MNYYNLVKIDDVLLQVIRDFNPQYFVTDGSNQMNQKLIGLWVEYLDGDRVVKQNNRILICRTIEDAIIEQWVYN